MLQCYTIKVVFMKKRFTIMLEEETIKDLKAASSYYNPIAWRKMLQRLLGEFAFCELNFHNDKRLTGKLTPDGEIDYEK